MKLKELINLKEEFQGKALCTNVEIRTAINGSNYLTLILKDDSGEIEARLWNYDGRKEIKNQSVIKFKGIVSEYKNKKQIKINNYKILNEDEYLLDDFMKTAPINSDTIFNNMLNIINDFENENYKLIMKEILKIYKKDFLIWPAAIMNHHEIRSGLIWHSWTMLRMAQKVIEVYQDREIDKELLYSGIILHDLGKVIEINNKQEFSMEGKLIGHISIMSSEVYLIGKNLNLNSHAITMLQHMILASHGKQEYGSPVSPQIIESEILHFLDNLDARIYKIDSEIKKIKKDEWTSKQFALEQRSFMKHKK